MNPTNPEDAVKEIRSFAESIIRGDVRDGAAAEELAQMVLQLDKWLRAGERIPSDWIGQRVL